MDPTDLWVELEGGFGAFSEYQIKMTYKSSLQWQVAKRHSDFQLLQISLTEEGFAVRNVPTDTYDSKRTENVGIYLKELYSRPDIRATPQLQEFLRIPEHTNSSFPPLNVEWLGSTDQGRMAVTQIATATDFFLVAAEDNTNACKLGKMWSIVEEEKYGSLTLYGLRSFKNGMDLTFEDEVKFPQRCRCLYLYQNRAYLGLDDGVIVILYVTTDDDTNFRLEEVGRLEMHKQAIVGICGDDRNFLSYAFDRSIRVFDCEREETVCGGRLNKRLGDAMITSAFLKSGQAFIGTSAGQVLIYDVKKNPPSWTSTLTMDSCGHEIACLHLVDKNLAVGYGHVVVIYNLELPKPKKVAMFSSAGYKDKVRCLNITSSYLFVGHNSGAMHVWSLRNGRCLFGKQTHSNAIKDLAILDGYKTIIITGSNDKQCKVVKFSQLDDPNWREAAPPISPPKTENEDPVSWLGASSTEEVKGEENKSKKEANLGGMLSSEKYEEDICPPLMSFVLSDGTETPPDQQLSSESISNCYANIEQFQTFTD